MNLEVLRRILDKAQETAPAREADEIRCILIELDMLDGREVEDLVLQADAGRALRAHVVAQPFEIAETEDDDGDVLATPISAGALHRWFEGIDALTEGCFW